MRALGMAIVLLSVVLGSGGVVMSSRADSTGETGVVESPRSLSQQTCRVPEPTRRRISLSLPERQEGELAFTLNTRGYNYVSPGGYRPPVPVPTD